MAEDQKQIVIGAKLDKGDFREVITAFKEVERAAISMADALNRAASGLGGAGGVGTGAGAGAGAATTAVGGVASASGAGPAGRGSSLGREIKGIRTEIRALIEDMGRLKREAQDFRSVVSGVGASAASARGTTMTVSVSGGAGTYTPSGHISGPPTPPTTVSSSGGTPPPPSGTSPVVSGSSGEDGVARSSKGGGLATLGQSLQLGGSAISGGAQFFESTQLMPLQAGAMGQSLNARLAHSIMTGRMSDMYAYQQLGQYAGMMQNYDLSKLFMASQVGNVVGSVGQGIAGSAALYGGMSAGGPSNPIGAYLTSAGMSNLQSGISGTASGSLQLINSMYDVKQQQLMTQLMDMFKQQYSILSQGVDMYGASLPARLQMQRQMGAGGGVGTQDLSYEALGDQFAALGFQTPENQIGQTMAAAKRFGFGRTVGGAGRGSLLGTGSISLSQEAQRMVPYGFDYGNTLSQFGLLSESARDVGAGMSVVEAMQGATGGQIPSFLSEQALEMTASQRMSPYGRMSGQGLRQYATLLTAGMGEQSSTLDLQQRARGLQSIGSIAQSSTFAFGSTYERLRGVIKDPMMRKIVAEAPLEKISDPNFMKAVGINANDLQIIKAAKLDPLAIGLTGKTYQDVKQAGGLSKYLSSATPADRERIATQLFATQGSRVGGDIETAAAGLAGFAGQLGATTTAQMPAAAETVDPSTRTAAAMAPSARMAVEKEGRLAIQAGQISQIFGNLIGPLMKAQEQLQTLAGQQIGKSIAPPRATSPTTTKGG